MSLVERNQDNRAWPIYELNQPWEMANNVIFPIAYTTLRKWNTILWEIENSFSSDFLSGLHVKNCYPELLFSIIYESTTKSSLVAIILCVSLCSMGFCSSRRLPIKVLLDRIIIKNPFFQTSVKKAVLYVVQCVFLNIKFCFQLCYLTDFVMRTKLISSYFSKKYHFINVNSFKLFLLSNQKHPLYHQTFQRFCQVSCTIQLDLYPLPSLLAHRFSKFSGSHFKPIMVSSRRLRIHTCYFYLGKLIRFNIEMPSLIGNLSWYFSKCLLAYLEYL